VDTRDEYRATTSIIHAFFLIRHLFLNYTSPTRLQDGIEYFAGNKKSNLKSEWFFVTTCHAVKCGNATELPLFTANSVWQHRLSDTSKHTHTLGYILVGFPQRIWSRWFSGECTLTAIAFPHFMSLQIHVFEQNKVDVS